MLIVNLVGLLFIALVVWWFWLYKPKNVTLVDGGLVVMVEGGAYSPARLQIRSQTPTTLTFLRKDASPCAEIVMIPDLDINRTLPLNKTISIEIPALKPGEYDFHCQMQMYRGKLTVV